MPTAEFDTVGIRRDPGRVGGRAHAAVGISAGAEGRYHSREFGEIAERLGLEIKYRDGVGWAPALAEVDAHREELLSPIGLKQFRADIRALDI